MLTWIVLLLFAWVARASDMEDDFIASFLPRLDWRSPDLDSFASLDDNQNPFSGPEGLQEFAPIHNTIQQSDTQYYSFNVNTSTGVGEFYELLIFLTGNVCLEPNNVYANQTGLAVYYSFNSSMMEDLEVAQMALFENGYFQALADVPASSVVNNNSVVYIAVRAPENINRTAQWLYQIGVSQNDLVFQWDDRQWALVVDTDESLVLIVTGNLTVDAGGHTNVTQELEHANASRSQYSLYLYLYDKKDYFKNLNASWCAVKNGPALDVSMSTSYTLRNGLLQQQFYITGLNESTKYLGYVLTDFRTKGSGGSGGAVYQQFEFETMPESACELIYDLSFCGRVAYSVPSSDDLSKEDLRDLYDSQARSLYTNFSKALQQIACEETVDARFSPVTTCDACAESYKNWLCAVTIPRCTARNSTGSRYRDLNQLRNTFIDEVIAPSEPYYEILPCVNVCHAIVRDCPADFSFSCPTRNESILLSYYWDIGENYSTCNYVGDSPIKKSSASRVPIGFLPWLLVMIVVIMIGI